MCTGPGSQRGASAAAKTRGGRAWCLANRGFRPGRGANDSGFSGAWGSSWNDAWILKSRYHQYDVNITPNPYRPPTGSVSGAYYRFGLVHWDGQTLM